MKLSESFAQTHASLKAGSYVALTVRDTGSGMSEETLSHLFEPFFTTKEIGKGTGLGLASVYGVVEQSGAHIHVTSEVGKGTMVQVYFPRVFEKTEEAEAETEAETEAEATKESLDRLVGTETILVVEDEEIVLLLIKKVLQELGYTVFIARQGEEALKILRKKGGDIRLILTDIMMPQMSGRELSLRAAALYPGIKILYMSGYPRSENEKEGDKNEELPSDIPFIQKPFSPLTLARMVRGALDAPPAPDRP